MSDVSAEKSSDVVSIRTKLALLRSDEQSKKQTKKHGGSSYPESIFFSLTTDLFKVENDENVRCSEYFVLVSGTEDFRASLAEIYFSFFNSNLKRFFFFCGG